MLLSTLHGNAVGQTPWIQTYATVPRTHTFAQLFLCPLDHSTFCVSTTDLSPQAFLVSPVKSESSGCAHSQCRSSTKWSRIVCFPLFSSVFFTLRCITRHHTTSPVFLFNSFRIQEIQQCSEPSVLARKDWTSSVKTFHFLKVSLLLYHPVAHCQERPFHFYNPSARRIDLYIKPCLAVVIFELQYRHAVSSVVPQRKSIILSSRQLTVLSVNRSNKCFKDGFLSLWSLMWAASLITSQNFP